MGFPQLHGHGDPIHLGHHNIDNRQMNLLFGNTLQTLVPVGGFEYHITLVFQVDADTLQDFLVVFHNQHVTSHIHPLLHHVLSA
ncbi:hypothetical protein D3C76_1466250 [compost metagenome]